MGLCLNSATIHGAPPGQVGHPLIFDGQHEASLLRLQGLRYFGELCA